MPCYALIADDLTGACDAGVQFARHGFPASVWLEPEFARAEAGGVTVLTTNSRRDTPEAARAKTAAACRRLIGLGAQVVLKKIDSTLQGHPIAEIEAVMEACGFPRALVCPAFPAMGRTVRGGRLFVHGVDNGVQLSGSEALAFPDAASQEDLAQIARSALGMFPPPLLAGSAGLAMEVAAQLAKRGPAAAALPTPRAARGPVLLFVGSTSPVTQEQVRSLAAERPGRDAVFSIDLSSGFEIPPALGRQRPGALVLTGGDTALLVSRALGVRGIRLEQEILTGIPWGRLIGGACDGLPVATKAGGFGPPDALVRVADFLSTLGEEGS